MLLGDPDDAARRLAGQMRRPPAGADHHIGVERGQARADAFVGDRAVEGVPPVGGREDRRGQPVAGIVEHALGGAFADVDQMAQPDPRVVREFRRIAVTEDGNDLDVVLIGQLRGQIADRTNGAADAICGVYQNVMRMRVARALPRSVRTGRSAPTTVATAAGRPPVASVTGTARRPTVRTVPGIGRSDRGR